MENKAGKFEIKQLPMNKQRVCTHLQHNYNVFLSEDTCFIICLDIPETKNL